MKTITEEQLEKLPHKFQVAFALFCAKQVSHLSDNPKVANYIETVEKWLDGKATAEDCKRVAEAFRYPDRVSGIFHWTTRVIWDTDKAAWAACWTTKVTINVIKNEHKAAEEQRKYYEELLNFDSIFDEEFLK